jgi:ABC-type glutathione transport system ATPase component
VESRVRHSRLSLKGGEEEKSPFDPYNIRYFFSLLDAYPTTTLRLPYNIESFQRISMDFAIRTENLGRIYKIRGGKKTEPKQLIALEGVNLEIQPGELFGLLA